jgi:L-lactate dehydrogenase complex protein LldG
MRYLMDSKQHILKAIRRHQISEAAAPNLDQAWITYADRRGQFAEMLQAVGGRCVPVAHHDALNAELAGMAAYAEARRSCSTIPGVGRSNVDLNAIDDPHALEDVDFAILPGEFAVAENAAVWVTDRAIKHRAIYFIPQHVALVVPADAILDNMHQAYERLAFEKPGFGVFISGPSKTADIEQSLVIGAHGPRSLTVFLLGNAHP